MSEIPAQQTWKQNRVSAVVVLLLLAVHSSLGLHAAFYNSVTNDEFWHIPTGLWNLKTGRFHYENLNPPLLRMLSAAPLVLSGAETGDVDEDADKESRADAFVAANRQRYSELVSLARLVPILISAITGWILASWALELFGKGAAVLAAATWALSPNIIAHSSLVTTDVAAAAAMLLVVRLAWQFAERPTWRSAIMPGLALGAAQLIKFTCLIAVPLSVAVWMIRRWRNPEVSPTGFRTTAAGWAVAFTLCLAVINAGYLFRGTGRSLDSYQFTSQSMQNIAGLLAPLSFVPVLFPEDYIEGIDHQRQIMEGAHPSYLDGQMKFDGGFRDYYFKAWWYKTPHATQFLCLLGVICCFWPWRHKRQFRLQLVLLLPIILLLLVASNSSMQLGLRYLIPVFPFVFLFASQVGSVGGRAFGIPQLTALLLAVGLGLSLRFHPHHLAYFNEYSGGPEEGHHHLLDSNIDWGQGLMALKKYMQEHQLEKVGLAYFGAVNPADLGISFVTAPQSQPPTVLWPHPEPGVYAISVNFLMGRPGMVRDPDGTTRMSGPHQFGYFRFFEADTKVAGSFFIYDLSAEDIARMPVDQQR